MFSEHSSYQKYLYDGNFGPTSDELAFKDFLPDCQVPHHMVQPGLYDNFRTLLDRANEWLLSHPEVDIKTCETVEFKTTHNEINPENMVYVEYGRRYRWFARGLRIWYKQCKQGEERVKQIGYVNIVPQLIKSGGIFSYALFENLDELILKYNNTIRSDPIPGRIITIETQNMRIHKDGIFDPDCSSWYEGRVWSMQFLFILRIFFEVMEPRYEEIGVLDFIPQCLSKSCMMFCCKYETFSEVLVKAFDWCSMQSHLRICNFQSLDIKLRESFLSRGGPEVDTKIMNYAEDLRVASFYVRTLRIAHIKRQYNDNNEFASELRFSSRCFVPVQLKYKREQNCFITNSSMPEFESLQETQKRINMWLKATGAEVLNVETLALRLKSEGAFYCSESTFSYNPKDKNEFFFYIIRLYFNGSYTEPAVGTLPPVPHIQTEGCIIL